jgi:hypothetical protein
VEGGVQLGPLGTMATNRPIVPAPGDYDYEEIGGMIRRENESARRKPVPGQLCPPQTTYAARTRTRAAVVGSQRLTTWATARPGRILAVNQFRVNCLPISYKIYPPTHLLTYISIYLSIHLFIYGLYIPFTGSWLLFQFLDLFLTQ